MVASLKGDTAKAADYSNQAVVDMADNANKWVQISVIFRMLIKVLQNKTTPCWIT